MSNSIDFYIIKEAEREACYRYVCRLVEKAYEKAHHIFIQTQSDQEAKILDEMLWTFHDISFIPHAMSNDHMQVPVQIGTNIPAGFNDILINLTKSVPDVFTTFARILSFVQQDPEWKNILREHYKIYRDAGCKVSTHDL